MDFAVLILDFLEIGLTMSKFRLEQHEECHETRYVTSQLGWLQTEF